MTQKIKNALFPVVSIFRAFSKRMPELVGIETQTACNRKCAFCPNANHTRKHTELPDETVRAILRTLAYEGFTGALHLHAYGEPLLDKRLPDLIRIAKWILPASKICVATNGDFLTDSLKDRLADAGLDQLYMTNYDDPAQVTSEENHKGMRITRRPFDFMLSNRAGGVTLAGVTWKRAPICFAAFRPWIFATGDIGYCCHDYAAGHGTGINVSDPAWVRKWNSAGRRFNRARSIFGPRPWQCAGCKVGKIKPLVPVDPTQRNLHA